MVDNRFFSSIGKTKLDTLLAASGADNSKLTPEQAAATISDAAPLDSAQPHQICLAAHKAYISALQTTKAGVVVVSNSMAAYVPETSIPIISESPHATFVAVLNHLFPGSNHHLANQPDKPQLGEPVLEDNVLIGKNVVLGSGVQIGAGTTIGPNTVIGPGVTIGRNSAIGANATIECALLGDHVIIGNGARVGAEGFGWLDHAKSNQKIPQLGRAILQSHVDIGANTTIDRGALGDTIIGENTKIGAMVEIGHNSILGRNCLLAPTVGLAGGTTLQDSVLMGANAVSAGHLTVGAGSVIHAGCAVSKDWPANSRLAGIPAQNIKDFLRELATIRKIVRGGK